MSDYKQVEEERDLVRDMHSKAIINTNKSAYLAAVQRKKVFQQSRFKDYGCFLQKLDFISCWMQHCIKCIGSLLKYIP